MDEAPAPPPQPAPAAPPEPAPAAAPRVSARRVIPAGLIVALAGSTGVGFYEAIEADSRAAEARHESRQLLDGASNEISAMRQKLDDAKKALADADAKLKVAQEAGSTDAQRLAAERDDAKKRAAALADKLGETEAERDKLKKHAAELDELMSLLEKKKVNVKRLAGVEGPPREDAEVVSLDERRTPPVLVLRVDVTDGIEEGDKLYLVRTADGKPRETGHAVVEKVDRARGLLSATIGRLAAGERVQVGDKLATYPPGS